MASHLCTVIQRSPLPNSYTREHEYFSGVWFMEHVKLFCPHIHKQPDKKKNNELQKNMKKVEPSGTEPLLISKKQCKWSSGMRVHKHNAVSITVTDEFLLRWRRFDETLNLTVLAFLRSKISNTTQFSTVIQLAWFDRRGLLTRIECHFSNKQL